MKKNTRKYIFDLAPYIAFFLIWLVGWPYFMDDAFITFTYARNLVETGEVTYNGLPVEGYTSFFQMILASLFLLLSTPEWLLPINKIFAFLLGILCLNISGRIMARAGSSPLAVRLGRLTLAFSPILAYQYSSGLETPIVYLISLVLFYLVLVNREKPLSSYAHLVAITIFGGMLVRPDFVLFTAPAVVACLGRSDFNRHGSWRGIKWSWFLCIIILGVFYLLWKKIHFGQVLPNPYYVKKYIAPTGVHFFWDKWRELLLLNPPIIFLGVLLILRVRKNPLGLITALAIAAYSLAFYKTNFWQDHFLRYFSPLVLIGITGCYALIANQRWREKTKSILLIGLTVASLAVSLPVLLNYGLYVRRTPVNPRIGIGKALNRVLSRDAIICTGDSGAIPFFAARPNIDIYFLNSPELFNNRVRGHYWGLNTNLVYSYHPHVLLLASSLNQGFRSGDGGNRSLSYEMSIDPEFKNYRLAMTIDLSTQYTPFTLKRGWDNFRDNYTGYIYHIMFRKDLEDARTKFIIEYSRARF